MNPGNFPIFILSICWTQYWLFKKDIECAPTLYDITYEPDKTHVEFLVQFVNSLTIIGLDATKEVIYLKSEVSTEACTGYH